MYKESFFLVFLFSSSLFDEIFIMKNNVRTHEYIILVHY